MKKYLLFCFAMVIALSTWAQDRTVTGKVTSVEDGSPLPGVNVTIKGTTNGTATNSEGNYSLNVAPGATLVFSFIGLKNQEVNAGDRTVVDVQMEADIQQLSEVVVVGYGTQERAKLSSSVASVSGTSISRLAAPSFDTQLSGRAAGVQVTLPSGIIGTSPVINIRGVNSMTSGSFPLVVIDGVPMTTGNQSGVISTNPLSSINPSDIESYEILKDGAATAIYGSRAANGVILITTKNGSKTKGKSSIDFNLSTGFSEAVNKFDLLNAEQFVQVANEKLANAGLPAAAFMDANNTNTDWQDEILRKGAFSNYNLGVGGSSEATNYYFSVGYQYQQSAVVANQFERLSFMSSVDHKLNKYIKMGTKVQMARSTTTGLNTGSNALSGNLSGGLRLFPNVPVKDPNNPTGFNLSPDGQVLGQGANTRGIDNNYTNQGFVLANNKFRANETRVLGNIYAEVTPIEWVTLRTFFGVDFLGNKDFQSWDPRHGDGRGSNGVLTNQYRQTPLWNWQNTLAFNRDFGDHGINAVLGTEYQKQTFESFRGEGTNFSDLFFLQNGLITNTYVNQFSGGTYNETSYQSLFGRVNYSFKDRYLIGFSARQDGLSRLTPENRDGVFFGASIGYRVSEEEFFKNSVISQAINSLKLRGSYAEVGNQDIGLFPYASLFGSARYASQNGIGFTQAGNTDLVWETSKKLNIGADFGILNNRVTFNFDYFKNDIDGNILAVPYGPSLGIPGNSINQNIGILSNSGLEFTVNATVLNKMGLTWNVNANLTTVKNEVIETFRNSTGNFTDIVGSNGLSLVARVGQPLNVIYGYEYAGVNPANGNPMYIKGNGSTVQRNVNSGTFSIYDPSNPTDETNTAGAALVATDIAVGGDRQVLGSTLPKYFGGLTNTFEYKGISLEIFARFSGGNKVYNSTRQDNLLNQDFTNGGTELLKSWRPDNTNTDVPKMWINRSAQVNQTGNAISRFVEKGDFVRVQNIILGYSLPSSLLEKTGNFKISSLRAFAQVQNAFTFTKYKGIDPELGAGFDNNTSPIFRTYTIGLNIGL